MIREAYILEKLHENATKMPRQKQGNADLITFISMGEVEKARRDLQLSQIDEANFSDAEIVLAIQQQKEVNASTIVPVVLDWLVEANFIVSGSQAAAFIRKDGKHAVEGFQYQTIGEMDFDAQGNYYLVVASSQRKKMESIYKVYTNGEIRELVIDN